MSIIPWVTLAVGLALGFIAGTGITMQGVGRESHIPTPTVSAPAPRPIIQAAVQRPQPDPVAKPQATPAPIADPAAQPALPGLNSLVTQQEMAQQELASSRYVAVAPPTAEETRTAVQELQDWRDADRVVELMQQIVQHEDPIVVDELAQQLEDQMAALGAPQPGDLPNDEPAPSLDANERPPEMLTAEQVAQYTQAIPPPPTFGETLSRVEVFNSDQSQTDDEKASMLTELVGEIYQLPDERDREALLQRLEDRLTL